MSRGGGGVEVVVGAQGVLNRQVETSDRTGADDLRTGIATARLPRSLRSHPRRRGPLAPAMAMIGRGERRCSYRRSLAACRSRSCLRRTRQARTTNGTSQPVGYPVHCRYAGGTMRPIWPGYDAMTATLRFFSSDLRRASETAQIAFAATRGSDGRHPHLPRGGVQASMIGWAAGRPLLPRRARASGSVARMTNCRPMSSMQTPVRTGPAAMPGRTRARHRRRRRSGVPSPADAPRRRSH